MTCETCEDAKRRLGPAGWKMLEERQVYKECLEMALKVIENLKGIKGEWYTNFNVDDLCRYLNHHAEEKLEQIHARLEWARPFESNLQNPWS